jgi:hypothetical protein
VLKRLDSLAFFNQALLSAFPMVAKLTLEKSRAPDWNDQLKESLKGKTNMLALASTKEPASHPRRRP